MTEIEKRMQISKYLKIQDSLPSLNEKLKQYSKSGRYNLFLYMHIGDDFQRICIKDEFEEQYGGGIHFIIQPNEEFLMKLFGITDYSVFNLKEFIATNLSFSIEDSVIKDFFIQSIVENSVSPYPNRNEPFIISANNEIQFDEYIKNGFPVTNSWQYIKACLGIMSNNEIKLSSIAYPTMVSESLQKKIENIAPIDKIVFFLPEEKSNEQLSKKIWNTMAKNLVADGFFVIENITSQENHVEGALDLNLSLWELLELAMCCKAVFSLRSGFCDILAAKGKNLYVLWSEMQYRISGEWFGFNNLYDGESLPSDIILSRTHKPSLSFNNKNILCGITRFSIPNTHLFSNDSFNCLYRKISLRTKRIQYSLRHAKEFLSYLHVLIDNKQTLVICISVKDDASHFTTKHENLFREFGLKVNFSKLFRKGYISIVDSGVAIMEKIAESQNELVEGVCNVSALQIKIKSSGFKAENYSSIRINNEEFSKNLRGLNIVVFDTKQKRFIDSVSVDAYADYKIIRQ